MAASQPNHVHSSFYRYRKVVFRRLRLKRPISIANSVYGYIRTKVTAGRHFHTDLSVRKSERVNCHPLTLHQRLFVFEAVSGGGRECVERLRGRRQYGAGVQVLLWSWLRNERSLTRSGLGVVKLAELSTTECRSMKRNCMLTCFFEQLQHCRIQMGMINS